MKKYTKTYFDYFGITPGEFVACECCGAPSTDIHHIIFRSHFGKKEQHKCDDISNLVALCRDCHNKAHDEILSKEYLKEIHNKNLVFQK